MYRFQKRVCACAFLLLCIFVGAASAIAAPPSNDSCLTPTVIEGDGVFPFDTREATTGPQGQVNLTCELGAPPAILNDVWFCWTASCTGAVTIETCNRTELDTKLALYQGCACPSTGQEPICCDDDACQRQSRIVCDVICGQQYLIHLGTSPNTPGGGGGVGQLKITCAGEPCPPPGAIECKTWTTIADFAEGTSFNLTPTPDLDTCLVLDANPRPFPTLGVAASARGTILRIAIDNTLPGYSAGDVMGEYLSSPDGRSRNPSRTTIDAAGNIWATNRDESSPSPAGGAPKGSVVRIGLVIGGTRGDKVPVGGGFQFVPNPSGQYLTGPFAYNTCDDRDGDGLIRTSRGYPWGNGVSDYTATTLAWSNSGGVDSDGGVATADDEAITAYVRVAGTNARYIAVDPAGDIWTGGLGNRLFEKLSGATAQPVPSTVFNSICGGYGGLIDAQNRLWSAQAGSSLMHYPAPSGPLTCLPNIPNYGVGIDPQTCRIWTNPLSGNELRCIDPVTFAVSGPFPHGSVNGQGCCVDSSGNVWVAHSLLGQVSTVGRTTTAGVHVGNVNLNANPSSAPGTGPTGVAVDANGKVWATNYYTNNVMRIDPADVSSGPAGSVDLVVDIGVGAGPYNYSDMGGHTLFSATAPQGSWTVVYDSGMHDCEWDSIAWTAQQDPGTNVIVQVRASNSPTPSGPWTVVTNNQALTAVVGRYIQIRATLTRPGCTDLNVSLCDLKVCKRLPCMRIDNVSVTCEIAGEPPALTGNYLYTYTITNLSGVTAHYMLLPNIPTSPHVVPLTPPLPNGQSRQVTIKLTGLPPQSNYCFFVILADFFVEECCRQETCIELPDCDCFQLPECEVVCDPATPGGVLLFFNLQNLTPEVIEHMFLIPQPFGSSVSIVPDYVDVSSLNPFQTQSFGPFAISGLGAAKEFCVRISIHDQLLFLERCCCSRVKCFTIPDCGPPLVLGDLNCDGVVDFADIDPFVAAISGRSAYELLYPDCEWLRGDMNTDGAVDFGDIDAFVAALGQTQ